ncbi:MAG: hypothetical protein U1F66_10150 [bacterium]
MTRKFPWFRSSLVALLAVWGAACSTSNIPRIGIQIEPLCAAVASGATQQFNARIFVDEVDQGIDNSAVTWSVFGGDVNGTITATGLYTAPNTVPPPAVEVTILATSNETNQENRQGQATAVLSGSCPAVPPPTQSF